MTGPGGRLDRHRRECDDQTGEQDEDSEPNHAGHGWPVRSRKSRAERG